MRVVKNGCGHLGSALCFLLVRLAHLGGIHFFYAVDFLEVEARHREIPLRRSSPAARIQKLVFGKHGR